MLNIALLKSLYIAIVNFLTVGVDCVNRFICCQSAHFNLYYTFSNLLMYVTQDSLR